MRLIHSHWFWLFAILTVVSGLDYWDHISRPGSAFEQAPGAWFGFTAASHMSVCAIAWLAAKGLARFKLPVLLADTLGIASAVAAHLLLTGPLWDRLFWDGGLYFDAVAIPVAMTCGLYLFYRLAFGFILKLRTTEPKSLP